MSTLLVVNSFIGHPVFQTLPPYCQNQKSLKKPMFNGKTALPKNSIKMQILTLTPKVESCQLDKNNLRNFGCFSYLGMRPADIRYSNSATCARSKSSKSNELPGSLVLLIRAEKGGAKEAKLIH
jgi:hypothetical protein